MGQASLPRTGWSKSVPVSTDSVSAAKLKNLRCCGIDLPSRCPYILANSWWLGRSKSPRTRSLRSLPSIKSSHPWSLLWITAEHLPMQSCLWLYSWENRCHPVIIHLLFLALSSNCLQAQIEGPAWHYSIISLNLWINWTKKPSLIRSGLIW
jgi:hypothetical protein